MEASDTFKHNGHTIEILVDEDSISPREDDNLGTMACFHSRYLLGDHNHGFSIEEAKQIAASKDVISLPLYLYDHSGLTMNTEVFSCPWDSGQVGFIFVEKDKVRAEYGKKIISKKLREKVIRLLK